MESWVDLGYQAVHRPVVELAISRSQVWRPNHYTIEPQSKSLFSNFTLTCNDLQMEQLEATSSYKLRHDLRGNLTRRRQKLLLDKTTQLYQRAFYLQTLHVLQHMPSSTIKTSQLNVQHFAHQQDLSVNICSRGPIFKKILSQIYDKILAKITLRDSWFKLTILNNWSKNVTIILS